MEDGLGSTHPAVAQIYDQLALFYFFDGACAEAEQMALKSKAAVDSAFEGGEDDPAVAMCQLRLGSVLLSELGLAAGLLLSQSSATAPEHLQVHTQAIPLWGLCLVVRNMGFAVMAMPATPGQAAAQGRLIGCRTDRAKRGAAHIENAQGPQPKHQLYGCYCCARAALLTEGGHA